MAHIITSGASSQTAFAQLLSNKQDMARVAQVLHDTILRSFGEDQKRQPDREVKVTQAETKRRFKMCETWFRRARGDLGFGLERTLDLMPHALRCAIDGVDFDPEPNAEASIWTPT